MNPLNAQGEAKMQFHKAERSRLRAAVNVTEGGQAVVAGDTVTGGQGERRRGMIENEQ